MKSTKKHTFRLNDGCPCGSGKTISECGHLDQGKFRIPIPSLRPPGAPTGFGHPRCYLQSTLNCSEKISSEHYLSRSILEQLGSGAISVLGMPWLPQGKILTTSINSLTANILCTRHNACLSPLDNEAGRYFSELRSALIDLERKTISRKRHFHLVSGEALELWMLKVACGLYYSVGGKDGEKISKNYMISIDKVQQAFFERQWDERAGLYLQAHTGSKVVLQENVGMIPLTSDAERRFCGATVSLLGFSHDLLFDTVGARTGPWTALTKRPSELFLTNRGLQHSIILTWPPGIPEASVRLQRGVKP